LIAAVEIGWLSTTMKLKLFCFEVAQKHLEQRN